MGQYGFNDISDYDLTCNRCLHADKRRLAKYLLVYNSFAPWNKQKILDCFIYVCIKCKKHTKRNVKTHRNILITDWIKTCSGK